MTEIKAYYEQKRYARRGSMVGTDIPAGWTLCWTETGKNAELGNRRYATKEEAEARIPAILEARDRRDASRTEVAAPAPIARPAQAHASCKHSDFDADGYCYSCGKHVVRGVASYL